MTILQMLNALPVVQKIMQFNLPIKSAYKIYSLAKLINDKRDFFINEEKKLIEKYQAEVAENGALNFKNEEDKNSFMEEHIEMLDFKVEDIEPLELSFESFSGVEISPIDISMLEGVINFID